MKLCRRVLCQRRDAAGNRLRSAGYAATYLYVAAYPPDTERGKGIVSQPSAPGLRLWWICRNVPLHWKRAAGLGDGGWRSVATLEEVRGGSEAHRRSVSPQRDGSRT